MINFNQVLLHEFFIRIFFAFLMGALIGLERQWRERTAGLRTNALVACGSATFALLSVMITEKGVAHVIIAQIVTGIGFLGAGVIMREGFNVRGLNTAATIWCSAAVGSLCGVGLILEASLTVAVVLLVNIVLRPVARYFHKQPLKDTDMESYYRFKVVCERKDEDIAKQLLVKSIKQHELRMLSIQIKKLKSSNQSLISAHVAAMSTETNIPESIVSKLSIEEAVQETHWEIVMGGFE